ncbi:hypothetical protein [Aureimonas sp. SK2]|uniref:hypothetical protein n=1 Tax=Aureimonas sp. SK2 TaxID=3015992 RepID=UPI00244440A2|nr:hypothetical protein [Aureimonas sp. SK2]
MPKAQTEEIKRLFLEHRETRLEIAGAHAAKDAAMATLLSEIADLMVAGAFGGEHQERAEDLARRASAMADALARRTGGLQ